MRTTPLTLAPLTAAAFLCSCQSCHDHDFCEDMIGHNSHEVMAWLGSPTGFSCKYGVDEYTWCANKEARAHSLREQPIVLCEYTDAEGLHHVHYRCIVPPPNKHNEDKDPHLTIRFYNDKACGFYIKGADKICNRFVPDHFVDTYREQHQQH